MAQYIAPLHSKARVGASFSFLNYLSTAGGKWKTTDVKIKKKARLFQVPGCLGVFFSPDSPVVTFLCKIKHGGLVNHNGTWVLNFLHAVFQVPLPELCSSLKGGLSPVMAEAIKAFLSI